MIEVTGQYRVAVKVEQPPFLCQEISEILLGRYLSYLTKGLVFRIMSRRLGAALSLPFQIETPPLGDTESFVDGLVQVRMLIFAQQMVRLMTDNNVAVTGNAELDVDHWGNRSGDVFGALVDAYPAGNQAVIEPLQIGNPGPDLFLGALGTLDVMKGNFERNLHS